MKSFLEKLKGSFSKEAFSAGLDIGTAAIKLAKLKFRKDTVELCSFDIQPVDSSLDSSLRNFARLHELRKSNISISGPATIIRYVNFPRMEVAELKQALKFEAQKHIPFSIAEVNLDSYILRPDLPDNKILVLLAAAKKEFIDQRLKLLEKIDVRVSSVNIDSIALINAFNSSYSQSDELKNKAVALLNIGATFSNLSILEAGCPRLSRDIHIAGNNLTQKIADVFGIDFKSAEGLKLAPDKERLSRVAAVVESVLSNLASELRTSFDYYESQCASTVVKIFLSGGGSLSVGLKDILSNLLGIEVECWDPLKKISLAKEIDTKKLEAVSGQLAVAVGLALFS